MTPRETPQPIDYGTVFEFQDSETGESFGVALATLLQCLCIAEQRLVVPPLDVDWEKRVIPPVVRERARLRTNQVEGAPA